jgi:predicted MFS family arabinose efflux permease
MTFMLMGIPGILLALVVKFTIVDPRAARTRGLAARPLPPLRTVFETLWRQHSFRHLCIAVILLYVLGLGMAPWYGAFLVRSHGMGTVELGVWLGISFGAGGFVGAILGGDVCSRWFRGDERSQMRMIAIAIGCIVPCFVAFLTLPGKFQAVAALVPLIMAISFFLGPTYALMQRLVADEMRATMMSIVMLLANLIGFGIGPQLVGILSDVLAPTFGRNSLRYAMLIMSFVALWSAFHFWRVGRTVKDDLRAAAAR